jgi:ribose transport system substrate-binding protein
MRTRTLCIGMAVAVVVAGCGSTSSGTTSSQNHGQPTHAATNPGVAAAQKLTAYYTSERSNMALPKLSKTPPKHYRIAILTCPLPACQQTTNGAVSAAKALGWSVDYVTYQLTPTAYLQAWNNLVQSPPNAVAFIDAFPLSTTATQFAKLHAAGTRIVVVSPQLPPSPNPDVSAVIQGPPEFEQGGVVAADAVVADAGGSTDAAVVTDPSYDVFKPAIAGFKSTMTAHCPSCNVSVLDISLANPAAQTDSAITNYLRQHTTVKYLFFVIGDAVSGLPGALASDGLTGTKIVSMTPDPSNIADIASGTEWAAVQIENATSGWRAVDVLARLAVGDGVGPENDPPGYVRLITKTNVVPGQVPATPGTPSDFLTAWGVSGQ